MKITSIAMIAVLMIFAPAVVFQATVEASEQKNVKAVYTCPMHPHYTSDKPGSCPICGMDLVKKEAVAPSGAGVEIDIKKQQLIGVRTDVVKVRSLVVPIRASARVVLDQEMYDAERAYLKQSVTLSRYWNTDYQKMIALGMSEEEITALKTRGFADEGIVAIGPSDKGHFYRTPYPDSSWVYAAVFENELMLVRPGLVVHLTAAAFPGETFEGVVAGVGQMIDPQTRTVRVRIRVDDKGRRLRPEMFMIATIEADQGKKLAVPLEAVLDSGERKIVYVVNNETFTPHEVELGVRAGDFVEVKSGLETDDKIVVGGNFLVDAESRLKSVVAP